LRKTHPSDRISPAQQRPRLGGHERALPRLQDDRAVLLLSRAVLREQADLRRSYGFLHGALQGEGEGAGTTTTVGLMRRIRTLSALMGVLALLVAAPGSARAADLKTGSTGPRVAAVQTWLHLPVDRVYGPATRQAVKRFQRRHGLQPDGIVGPATWTALKRARDGGSRGARVRLLQRELGIGADGVFGPGTQRAVKRFQRRHGLQPDGIVGPATWRALGHPGMRTMLRRTRPAPPPGGVQLVVRRVIAAGSRIAHAPYKYGGGHRSWRDTGYDCSGSVSFALHGAGLLDAPLTSGDFMRWGSPGKGRHITIYASPGHVYMIIEGRRFDTTGRDESGSRWQVRHRSPSGYAVRHPPSL
jgi:peptidoglycan hydrolase-like protein with peptidoglycan-binding domain